MNLALSRRRASGGFAQVVPPQSPAARIIYVIAITIGFLCMTSGVGWMLEIGAASIIICQLVTGRFSGGKLHMAIFGYGFVLFALAAALWMFLMDYESGHIWHPYPPKRWFVLFMALVWLIVVYNELKQLRKK
jgi:hypothetical protein